MTLLTSHGTRLDPTRRPPGPAGSDPARRQRLPGRFWQYWAAQTRGAAAAIGTDGAPPRGLDLTTLIIGLLQEA